MQILDIRTLRPEIARAFERNAMLLAVRLLERAGARPAREEAVEAKQEARHA